MILHSGDLSIMNRLIGPLDEKSAMIIKEKIDCLLHSKVSLFIPASGQCKYAIRPGHTHPAYSFIYYFQFVGEFIVEGKSISYDISDGKCLSAMSPAVPHQEPEQEGFQSYIAILIDAALFHETMLQYTQSDPLFRGERFKPHPELLGLLKCFMLEAVEYEYINREYLDQLALAITHLVVRSLISQAYKAVHLYERF